MSKSNEVVVCLDNGDHLDAKQIEAASQVVCIVSRKLIEAKDYTTVQELLEEFRKSGCGASQKLELVMTGFEHENRKFAEIREVREFIQALYAGNHEFFLYLTDNSIDMLLS